MIRKLSVAIAALLLAGLGAGLATAEPGPNGNNDHGLCTAYFNGQKVGHGPGEDTDDPPPFQGLQEAGEYYTDHDGADNDRDGEVDEGDESEQLTDAENIFNFCNDTTIIGGNPDHGRFTCQDEGGVGVGPDTETDPECTRNDKPGNG